MKIIRLAYEHIEENETFSIAIPEDEGSDSEEELNVDDLRVESLSYLVSLLEKPTQKLNAEDLNYYMNAFVTYSESH